LSLVLKRKLPALNRLLESDPRVLGVFLFGSQVEVSATPRSDIDLGVLFNHELTLNEELAFEVAVSEVLGTDDVDVVDLNRASLLFRFRAIAGKLLYERDYVRISDFIERTLIEYRDFEPRAQAALRDYFAAL
jgi:predicted nucleotidyltransferase